MNIEEAVRPEVLEAAENIRDFIDYMMFHPEKLEEAEVIFRRMVKHHPLVEHDGFYTTRMLTANGAEYFLAAADAMSQLFEPNSEEEQAYQIPEIVLDHYPHTAPHSVLARRIAIDVLWPMFHVIYGNPPNYFSSIQLARYSHPDNRGTGWHCDVDSEATCVVSLAPERHEGGGTLLRPRGALGPAVRLEPLPKGQALLLNGRCTLHRGLEVEGGERNLLVYWMTNK